MQLVDTMGHLWTYVLVFVVLLGARIGPISVQRSEAVLLVVALGSAW